MISIDLNADLGEGATTDTELLNIVSSASIACGGHAGNAITMRQTLVAAKARGVTCGAHPGFVDPAHFGRRRLNLNTAELTAQIQHQITDLMAIAAAERVPITYVKLHGALANMAAEDQALAEVAFSAVTSIAPGLAVLALDNSAQVRAAEALGLPVIHEAYADRAYTADGLLVSRVQPNAVLTDAGAATAQCLRLAQKGEIVAIDGSVLHSAARSICLHGDTPGALALAQHIHAALTAADINICSN